MHVNDSSTTWLFSPRVNSTSLALPIFCYGRRCFIHALSRPFFSMAGIHGIFLLEFFSASPSHASPVLMLLFRTTWQQARFIEVHLCVYVYVHVYVYVKVRACI
mmetsp:Transcript_11485/g.30500  ORF Transcript_11485/g.30500 Transcript_11485/m.30500 type:complete len:104 (-) Transcript_11485:3826-4137(-)